MTTLTDQQEAGIRQIKQWFDNSEGAFGADVFRLFGPAGTGKTTMAKAIPAALGLAPDEVRYGTFTGKAAHVLRSKGATPVSTIHSGIYFPTQDALAVQRLRDAEQELAELGDAILAEDGDQEAIQAREAELALAIPELRADARRLSWEWNPDSEWSEAKLIILDEVSMVGAKLAADIERYEIPILVLGDPAQLPPVEGGGYYTDAEPDFLLTEIHRQALESPVLELATRVRLSQGPALGLTARDMRNATVAAALEADQVLVWSNKRRWALINAMRSTLGRPGAGQVVPGDRIMCLSNNKDAAVFNGQQFDVLEVTPATLGPTLRVRTEEGVERDIPTYADGFQGQEPQQMAKNGGLGVRGQRMLATYANAITVHKAQGSEWPKVYIVNETGTQIWAGTKSKGARQAIAETRQWLYTAVTRASDQVVITSPTRR